MLRDATGRVFPAAQLIAVDHFSLVFERAVGDCDPETLFDIASLTKPLSTTTLAMMALDEGALALDDRPRTDVTVAQLLTHSSGLPAWKLLGDTRAEVLRAVAAEPLESPPGTRRALQRSRLHPARRHRRAGARRAARRRVRAAHRRAARHRHDLRPARRRRTARRRRASCAASSTTRTRAPWAASPATPASSRRRATSRASCTRSSPRGTACARRRRRACLPPARVRQMWTPSTVPGSTWCLGWDRPSAHGSSAGERWPSDGVGHLGFTGCSIWIDPPRARWVVLLSNRVHPTRANDAIKQLRPAHPRRHRRSRSTPDRRRG